MILFLNLKREMRFKMVNKETVSDSSWENLQGAFYQC